MTKKTRYGEFWHYNCPQCDISQNFAPQLNFKNRCCYHCGWNDFGADPNTLVKQAGGPPVFGKSMVCGCPNVITISHFGSHKHGVPPAQPGSTCFSCGETLKIAYPEDFL